MRFFRYSFIFTVVFVIVLLGIVLSVQEWVLFQANNQLLASVGSVQKTRQGTSYFEYCKNLGTESFDNSPMYFVQLRFTSSSEYVIEVLCDQYEFAPMQISQQKLPLFATKKPGQSGFIFLEEGTWSIAIQAVPNNLSNFLAKIPALQSIFFRTKVITVENGRVVASATTAPEIIRPVTNCAGYGFSCCDPVQKLGIGEQRPATDCSDDCYASCQQRPIILSFNGEPGFDRYQRLLQVSQSDEVIFSFVLESLLPEMSHVLLEFGDGTSWTGLGTETTTTHQYACPQSECVYSAVLRVTDPYGTQSAPTAATQIRVVVHR